MEIYKADVVIVGGGGGGLRAAIAVADAHGLTTVAEYVESASLAEQLRGMGVRWGQGYHFGRPEPIAARLLPAAVAPAAAVQ